MRDIPPGNRGLTPEETAELVNFLYADGWFTPIPASFANSSREDRIKAVNGPTGTAAAAIPWDVIWQILMLVFQFMGRGTSPAFAGRDVLNWFRSKTCSVPDVIQGIPAGAEAVRTSRWPTDEPFTVHIPDAGLGGFDKETTRKAWVDGLASWTRHVDAEFRFVDSPNGANMVVDYQRIDGRGRILAWMQLPTGPLRGNETFAGRFDTAEAYGSVEAMQEVIAHEVGHWWGLPHQSRGNLMQPFATGRIITPQRGDLDALFRLGYPRRNSTPNPPPPPTDPPPPPPPPPGPVPVRQITHIYSPDGIVRWSA